jgi:hypothetical protein
VKTRPVLHSTGHPVWTCREHPGRLAGYGKQCDRSEYGRTRVHAGANHLSPAVTHRSSPVSLRKVEETLWILRRLRKICHDE